jgi:tyrosine-protein kinase
VRPVWQRKWLVLLIVLVATGGAYLRSVRQPKVYNAGTLVYYQPGGDPLNGGVPFTTDRTVEDVAALMYAENVAVAVARRINYAGTPGDLVAHVTITDRTGEDFVAISGSAGSGAEAAVIANGYAQQLVTITNGDQSREIATEEQGLKQQLAQTGTSTADLANREVLSAEIGKLQLASGVATGTRQVSPASPPSQPTSPKPVRDAIFALFLSLALALAIAFSLDRFDRRLKRPEDLEHHYGLPLLTVLPHSSDPAPRSGGGVGLGPGFHEAFGMLRTNISLLSLDAPPRSIVICSAIPGEGKSTVVRNLAIAMREAGRRVAVVETDLRRPAQSGLFGLPAGLGLTDVLTGAAELSDVLHSVPVSARGIDTLGRINAATRGRVTLNGHADDAAHATISVLLAGPRPPNPSTVLDSDRVVQVLDDVLATHDVVILDSAPLLSCPDSVPLLRYAEAALIVGRLNLTTRDGVRRMLDFLKRMPNTRVLGVIANDLSELDSGVYGYGGGYGQGYTSRFPPLTPAPKPAESSELA